MTKSQFEDPGRSWPKPHKGEMKIIHKQMTGDFARICNGQLGMPETPREYTNQLGMCLRVPGIILGLVYSLEVSGMPN